MTAALYIRAGSLPVLMSSSAKHYTLTLLSKFLSTGFLKSISPLMKSFFYQNPNHEFLRTHPPSDSTRRSIALFFSPLFAKMPAGSVRSIRTGMSGLSLAAHFTPVDPVEAAKAAGLAQSSDPNDQRLGNKKADGLYGHLEFEIPDNRLADLRAAIPRTYRDRCWPIVKELHESARKVSHVDSTLRKLRAHKASGTFPEQLVPRAKPPYVQYTGVFRAVRGKESDDGFIKLAREQSSAMLEAMIKAKEAEQEYLLGRVLSKDKYIMHLTMAIEVDFAAAELLHEFHTSEEMDLDTPKYPAWLIAKNQRVNRAIVVIPSRAIELARCNTASANIKAASKKEAKDRATVAAADAPNPQFTPAQTAEIQRAIAAALKSAGKSGKNKGKLVSPSQIQNESGADPGDSSRSRTLSAPAVEGAKAQQPPTRQQSQTGGFKGHKRQRSSWGGGGQ